MKTFDDAIRRAVEEKRRQARDEPSKLILNQLVQQFIDVWLLRRIAGKLGLNLTRLQAYALIGIFGRDPGYPLSLIWQERSVKPEVSAAAKNLVNEWMATVAKARSDVIKSNVGAGFRSGPVGGPTRPSATGGRKLPGEFDDE